MNKAVTISMISLTILIAVLAVALVVFIAIFDLNDYKDRISRLVHKETGRTLTFEGDLKLLLFPRPGVELGGLSLSNADGFDGAPMATVGHGRVTVKILPLLTGKVSFDQLVLDGLEVNLGRKEDGTSNWDDLVGRSSESANSDDGSFSLEVGGVSVSGGSVVWDDRSSGTRFTVRGIDASTGKIAQGALFPVELDMDFDCTAPDARGHVSLEGKSSIDLEHREYGHMGMKVVLKASGGDVPGGSVDGTMALDFMSLDFNKEHVQISGLEVSAYGATVHVDGTLDGIMDTVRAASGTVSVDTFDLRKTLAALGEPPVQTAAADSLTKVSGMTEFRYTPGMVDAETVQMEVDGTRLVGQARIEQGSPGPKYFARLDVGPMNLDRYLPPDHPEKPSATGRSVSESPLSAEMLRSLDADVETKFSELIISRVHLSNVVATLKAGEGLVKFAPVSADAYGGVVQLGVTMDATGPSVQNSLTVGVKKIDIGALSTDVRGKADYAGIADFNAALTCVGTKVADMRRTLGGTLDFHLADGVFPGVNLTKMTRETHQRKGSKGKVEGSGADSTKFGSIEGSGFIKNGVLHNDDLEVKAPGLRATGHGAVSLVTEKIDYIVKAKLVASREGQGGKSSDQMFGVMVPIHVTGTLDNPSYWVSLTEYVKSLGGVVIGTVGSVVRGALGAVKAVGSALDESCCDEESTEQKPAKKKFLGIF